MKRLLLVLAFVLVISQTVHTQSGPFELILDWTPETHTEGVIKAIQSRVNSLSDFFIRVTSPDISSESRRLWVISLDGLTRCQLSGDVGVKQPRWGIGGNVLYLMEHDTNNDGFIDFKDDFLIRVISSSGGEIKTVGQGRSAIWAPDGKQIALIRDSKLFITDVQGNLAPLSAHSAGGKLIVTNSRNPKRATVFWTVDTQTGQTQELPQNLREKYLWLGLLSPSGDRLVFSDETHKDLHVRDVRTGATRNITNDEFLDLDPSWSPDGRSIIYVSTNPNNENQCDKR